MSGVLSGGTALGASPGLSDADQASSHHRMAPASPTCRPCLTAVGRGLPSSLGMTAARPRARRPPYCDGDTEERPCGHSRCKKDSENTQETSKTPSGFPSKQGSCDRPPRRRRPDPQPPAAGHPWPWTDAPWSRSSRGRGDTTRCHSQQGLLRLLQHRIS